MEKRILEVALNELKTGIRYYEKKEKGLGFKLKREFEDKVKWLQDNPKILSIREEGYRRLNLKIFPYYIAYAIRNDILWILAIAHSHSIPKQWSKRI